MSGSLASLSSNVTNDAEVISLMIAGIVVLRHPFETAAVLAIILGVVWIVTGAVDVIDAVANGDSRHRLLPVLAGLATIAAGVILVSWPAPTVEVIARVTGFSDARVRCSGRLEFETEFVRRPERFTSDMVVLPDSISEPDDPPAPSRRISTAHEAICTRHSDTSRRTTEAPTTTVRLVSCCVARGTSAGCSTN